MNMFEDIEKENILEAEKKVATVATWQQKGLTTEDDRTNSVATPDRELATTGNTISAMKPEDPEPASVYHFLAEIQSKGLTDLDVDQLDCALFLFALDLIERCPAADFEATMKLRCPKWRQLPEPAWSILAGAIKTRMQKEQPQ